MKVFGLFVGAVAIGVLAGIGCYLMMIPALAAPIYTIESWPTQATLVSLGAPMIVMLVVGGFHHLIDARKKAMLIAFEIPAQAEIEEEVVRVPKRREPIPQPPRATHTYRPPVVTAKTAEALLVDDEDDAPTDKFGKEEYDGILQSIFDKSEESAPRTTIDRPYASFRGRRADQMFAK